MQSNFNPRNIKRAKKTLHRQLEVVEQMCMESDKKTTLHSNVQRSFWQRILHFFTKQEKA